MRILFFTKRERFCVRRTIVDDCVQFEVSASEKFGSETDLMDNDEVSTGIKMMNYNQFHLSDSETSSNF